MVLPRKDQDHSDDENKNDDATDGASHNESGIILRRAQSFCVGRRSSARVNRSGLDPECGESLERHLLRSPSGKIIPVSEPLYWCTLPAGPAKSWGIRERPEPFYIFTTFMPYCSAD